MTDLTRLRELAQKATFTPWIRPWGRLTVYAPGNDDLFGRLVPSTHHRGSLQAQVNIDFAVAAVNALPALLDENDRLREALQLAESKQAEAVEAFRQRGIVFATDVSKSWEGRTEAEQWEVVALSLYTDLVEISMAARAALESSGGPDDA